MLPRPAARELLYPYKEVDFFISEEGFKHTFFDSIVDYCAERCDYEESFLANEVWMLYDIISSSFAPNYKCHLFCNLLRDDGILEADIGLAFGLSCVLILHQGLATPPIHDFFYTIAKRFDLTGARNLYFALHNKNPLPDPFPDPQSLLPLILGSNKPPQENSTLIDALLPFFKRRRDRVLEFLATAQGAEPKVITSLVNKIVKNGEIDGTLTKKGLYEILYAHGIFTGSKTLWYDQVDFN